MLYIALSSLYMLFGIGVGNAISIIAERKTTAFDMLLWPIALLILAFSGEIS